MRGDGSGGHAATRFSLSPGHGGSCGARVVSHQDGACQRVIPALRMESRGGLPSLWPVHSISGLDTAWQVQ